MDYPTIGPQHSALYETERATHTRASDEEALPAFKLLGRIKVIIPVLESSHALAYLITHGKKIFTQNDSIIVNLSGRGDKDLLQVMQYDKSN
ncbi:hypothetical protein [Candidatus Coxiella mudrowiae]|uniref:hypothetical protein n=1 Tax=Candidatus Coxiella mudrowiae TaxID=2054173 RepID=UPI000B2737D6|nr:hypothetical protein [Candidatus Coxiella mudrowiae]